MEEEYFMQVKTFEEEKQAGVLEHIVIALDGKAEYYESHGLKAYSWGGYSDSIDLDSITEFDKTHKKFATWYMLRITDFVKTIPEVQFDELCGKMVDVIYPKVPILASLPPHKDYAGICAVYRVTATDAPGFRIIR
jgi:hypothetical protein